MCDVFLPAEVKSYARAGPNLLAHCWPRAGRCSAVPRAAVRVHACGWEDGVSLSGSRCTARSTPTHRAHPGGRSADGCTSTASVRATRETSGGGTSYKEPAATPHCTLLRVSGSALSMKNIRAADLRMLSQRVCRVPRVPRARAAVHRGVGMACVWHRIRL